MSAKMKRLCWIAVVAVAIVGVGCGQQRSEEASSGTSMLPDRDPGDINLRPVIRSVRFKPTRPAPGDRLQAIVEADDPDGEAVQLRYEWEIGGRRILATEREIVVPEAAKGSLIQLTVVATDGIEESAAMIAEARLGNRPPRITALEIEVIETSEQHPGEPFWQVSPVVVDPDGDIVSNRYVWLVNDRELSERGNRLKRSTAKRGDEVRVRVVANDGEAESTPLESAAITIGNGSPVIVSRPPGIDSSGAFRYRPEVSDPDRDKKFKFDLVEGPKGMSMDPATGELAWTPGIHQAGSHSVMIEVADEHGGASRQAFRVSVQVGGSPAGPAAPR